MIIMKKEINYIIHVWEIKGLVNINKKFKASIKNYIFLKNKSYQKTSCMIGKISGATISNFLRNKQSFMKISNLFRLTNSLDIPKKVVENNIISYKDHNAQKGFRISFPYKFNPLVLRAISHIPGDGCIRKDGFARWTQNNTIMMLRLLEKIRIKTKSNKSKSVCIPKFLVKVSCITLGLKPMELKNSKFVERVLNLPRLYRIQTLLALIEDEANIDAKNYGTINIRLANKDLILAYSKLCDSLNYKRSNISDRKNTGFNSGKKIYKLSILAEGIRRLKIDYDLTIDKFGSIGGLWKRDRELKKRCRKCLNEKALKDEEGKKITKEILKLLFIYEYLSVKKICKLIDIKDYNRIYDKVRYLMKKGKIKRVDYGKYTLVKNL